MFTPRNYPSLLQMLPNPDVVFLASIPVHELYLDPICLVLSTLFLLLITPLIACLTITTFRIANNAFYHLVAFLDRANLLEIFILFYHFHCDELLRAGDVHENPGPAIPAFRFIHWNANSLPAHEYARIPLIQAYNAIHNCQLIAITESALKNDIPDEKIEIPGYIPIRCDLSSNHTHGGVLIYHKIDLSVRNRPDLCLTLNTIVLELSISRKKLFFVCSYRRNGQTQQEYTSYCEKIGEMLDKIDSENPFSIILTGDFNAHNKKWYSEGKTDKFGQDMQEIFEKHCLYQTVNQPTHITGDTKTCIDLVCTDQPNLIMNNEIHPSLHDKCHHQVNYIKFNLKCIPPAL